MGKVNFIYKKIKYLGYKVLSFSKLKYYKKFYILSIRNHKSIRKHMVNKNLISVKEHFKFLQKLKYKKIKSKYFAVLINNLIFGVFYIKPLDKWICEIGLYLHPRFIGKGKGKTFLRIIQVSAQHIFKFKEIKLFVDKNNKKAIKFYLKNGFEIYKENKKYLFLRKVPQKLCKFYHTSKRSLKISDN